MARPQRVDPQHVRDEPELLERRRPELEHLRRKLRLGGNAEPGESIGHRPRSYSHRDRLASMALDPARVVSQLRELRELTGDESGAQRVAWTETWNTARAWLAALLADLPLEVERDEAGNDWWTLRGDSETRRPDRRAHRLRPERWLARRQPRRASPGRRCCGESPRQGRRPSRFGSSTGPTKRVPASAGRFSAPRRRRAR